jgi:glucose/arabinose dehydrogenase
MAEEQDRAAILEIDASDRRRAPVRDGLRNPVGLDWNLETGQLWTAVNERDELGSDLVPDYMTSVRPGGFYGWPWSITARSWTSASSRPGPTWSHARSSRTMRWGRTPPRWASAFADGARLGPAYANGAFVGQHGSWNASRAAATRSCSCRSGRADPPG